MEYNSAIKKNETRHLQIEFYFFLSNVDSFSFSFLIAVARTFRTVLNNSSESGHPCLLPDLRGNAFSFSPLRIMFAVGLLYMAFIMLRFIMLSMSFIMKSFYHIWVLNSVKSFFCIY